MLGITITQKEAEELIREEGRVEGREEGREEGRKEGREKGREEGRKEGAIALIRAFKSLGTSIDTVISALTQNFPLSGTEAEQLTRLYWK